MSNNSKVLSTTRTDKKDEFYTRYEDIELEINEYLKFNPNVFRDKIVMCPCDNAEWSNFPKYFVTNFDRLRLKKLICTCYIEDISDGLFSLSEEKDKTKNGRIFIMDKNHKYINPDKIPFDYLETDGDFANMEITKLRNESDIIVTNPPFSLFRKFIKWCQPEKRSILLIGNMNACSCKDVFKLFMDDKIWLGMTGFNTGMYFNVPDDYKYKSSYTYHKEIDGKKVMRVPGVCWFTNIEHSQRYKDIKLVDKDILEYKKYDRYDALDIPNINMIPDNYNGKMGVPITFLNRYNPKQFEILGMDMYMEDNVIYGKRFSKDGVKTYARIIIKRKINTV